MVKIAKLCSKKENVSPEFPFVNSQVRLGKYSMSTLVFNIILTSEIY